MVDLVLDAKGKNALGTTHMTRLLADLDAAGDAPLLVRGAGGAFSAGLDLREVASLRPDEMGGFLRLLERLFTRLYLHPAPTVALVNGHAIAGGCVLALCCDARIAAADPGIKIGLNEVAIGVVFPPRTLAICRARVPRAHEVEVLLGGGLFAPERARALGLVDAVAADAETAARQRLAELAAHPRDAYAMVKRDLRGASAEALASDEALERYVHEAVPIWTGQALKDRVARILGGRG
jgi:enoyl-CoA hydratase/carnithine racemase